MRKIHVAISVVLLTMTLLAGAWRARKNSAPSAFDVTTVVRGDLVAGITATGSLQPRRTVDIKYDGQELIQQLAVREGDRVHRGEIVARMDTRVLDHQYAQNLQAINKDKASLTQAEAAFNREQMLFQEGIIARAELETYQAVYRALVYQVRADEQAALETKQQIDRASLISPVSGLVTEVYVHSGEMLGSATAVAGLGPSAAISKPTNVLLTIAEGGDLAVYADVNAADLGQVFMGQPVEVSIDAFRPTLFHGTVQRIALQPLVLNNVTTFQVVVTIHDPDRRFRIGQPADVMLFRVVQKNALIVPSEAVRTMAGGSSVCLLQQKTNDASTAAANRNGDTALIGEQLIPVQILARTNDAVAVAGNLSQTDWIAARINQCRTSQGTTVIEPHLIRTYSGPSFAHDAPLEDGKNSALLPPPEQKSWLQRALGL